MNLTMNIIKRSLTLFFVGVLTLVLSLSSGYAKGGGGGKGGKSKATPTPEYHTVIASISANSITVNSGTNSKTYKIDQGTQFTYQGNSVKAADLKPGMRVSIATGADDTTASAVSATEAPTAAKGKK